jgi:arsenate reductase
MKFASTHKIVILKINQLTWENSVILQLNGLKACDTCRKAHKALQAAGQEVAFRDLRETPPNLDEVQGWMDAVGLGILNTRSTTWRGLSEAEREGDSLELMLAHPALIKRPVIVAGDQILLGWTKDTQTALGL